MSTLAWVLLLLVGVPVSLGVSGALVLVLREVDRRLASERRDDEERERER